MQKVLAHFLVLLAVLVAAAGLSWESSALGRVSHQSGSPSLLMRDATSFEDDDTDDDDDVIESGLPAPNTNDDDGADADANPFDDVASSSHVHPPRGTTPRHLTPPGIRPSGGYRPTSDRPPRV